MSAKVLILDEFRQGVVVNIHKSANFSPKWIHVTALLVSVSMHAGILFFGMQSSPLSVETKPVVQVRLLSSTVEKATIKSLPESTNSKEQESLEKPPTPSMSKRVEKKTAHVDSSSATLPTQQNWKEEVQHHLEKVANHEWFYPEIAIRSGWEGIAWLSLRINDRGQVVQANIQQSSGYSLLDQSAIRALSSLMLEDHNAPRELVLPVSFRLTS